MFNISQEGPADGPVIEALLDAAFGPERHARPSYPLRDGLPPVATLCFAAREAGTLIGTIRYWPLAIPGAQAGLLLGPIAVNAAHSGRGVGSRLVTESLAAARVQGHDAVAAIGEGGFLGRFGFRPAGEFGLGFPAPVPPERFHALELAPGTLAGRGGTVAKWLGGV
jgi:predicted N-acetyltransferase YhbS